MVSIYSTSYTNLKGKLLEKGFNDSHAKTIFTHIYKKSAPSFDSIPGLPKKAYETLESEYSIKLPKVVKEQVSTDGETIKFLVELEDSNLVETVLVPFNKKYTVCLSSQVGCAMKCSFCFTGTQGLTRHLKAQEIIGQYLIAYNWLKNNKLEKSATPNIVFMGQGEPLHNFKEVKKAIDIFLTTEGLHLGPRQITLSTAGYLPEIKNFGELQNINLALSFHSPFNEQREKLIPLNRAYPIEDIITELKKIDLMKRQYLTFEYLVIKDLNHSEACVQKMTELLKDLPVIINLIPFNEFPGCEYKRPDMEKVELFKQQLVKNGFHVMIRKTKGDDILAACGQLNTK